MTAGVRYPRRVRVRARADFDRIFASATRTASPMLALHLLSEEGPARLGLAVSRKVDKRAVGRNRIKRVLRESVATLESQLAARHAGDDTWRPRHLDRAHRTPPSSAKRPRTGPRRGDSRQPYRHFVAVPGNRRRPPSMSRKTICEEAPCPRRPPTAG
jgi:ribonuclease P protein component